MNKATTATKPVTVPLVIEKTNHASLESRVGAMVSAMASFESMKGTLSENSTANNKSVSELTRTLASPNVHVAISVTNMVNVLNQFNEYGRPVIPLITGTTVTTTLNITDPFHKNMTEILASKKS